MKIFKLFGRFIKYVFTRDNPASNTHFITPLLIFTLFVVALIINKKTDDGERIEFISYSPIPSPAGKLSSLAYYSALNGDLELGKYFYELSLEYSQASDSSNDDLYKIIYPQENLKIKAVTVSSWLKKYPTSRDLHIIQAKLAQEMNNDELLNRSITTLRLVDPNNEAVLGLIDL